jgi:hypothetical protein
MARLHCSACMIAMPSDSACTARTNTRRECKLKANTTTIAQQWTPRMKRVFNAVAKPFQHITWWQFIFIKTKKALTGKGTNSRHIAQAQCMTDVSPPRSPKLKIGQVFVHAGHAQYMTCISAPKTPRSCWANPSLAALLNAARACNSKSAGLIA